MEYSMIAINIIYQEEYSTSIGPSDSIMIINSATPGEQITFQMEAWAPIHIQATQAYFFEGIQIVYNRFNILPSRQRYHIRKWYGWCLFEVLPKNLSGCSYLSRIRQRECY